MAMRKQEEVLVGETAKQPRDQLEDKLVTL